MTKYRCFDVTFTSLGKNSVLVRSPRSDAAQVLPSSQAQLLLACRTFETISDHAIARSQEGQHEAARNTNSLRGKLLRWALEVAAENDVDIPVRSREAERIERQLSSFVEDGFLVSEADLQAEIQEIGKHSISPGGECNTISNIGIATCNRTEDLERALISYIENSRRYGRNPSFVIIAIVRAG